MRDFKPRFHRKVREATDPNTTAESINGASPSGLSLTRKVGEAIVIGDDVFVTVTKIQGQKVRLCVTAPPEVQVDRVEVRAAKEAGPDEKPRNYRA